jgi:hypothetical protein
LTREVVRTWVEESSQGRSKSADDTRPGAEVAETTVKRLLRVLTYRYSDGTSVSVLVEDMSRNKCFFQVGISHVFGFISLCDLFTDSPSLSLDTDNFLR